MNLDMVRITKRLSFTDIANGVVSRPDAYQTIVTDWIIKPAQHLTTVYPTEVDHGMALFALELMFFEPHGQFLSGKTKRGNSCRNFCEAFERFRQYLSVNHQISEDTDILAAEAVYTWARCGLFHSGHLATDLLVDAMGYSDNCLSKNYILGGWLVNPWAMLPLLEKYLNDYIADLKEGTDLTLISNFNKTFNALFEKPIYKFSKNVGGITHNY